MNYLEMTPKRISDVWKVYEKNGTLSCQVLSLTGIYTLDHVSYYIWELCDGNTTVKKINDKIKSKYQEVDPKVIENDILELLKRLERDSMIILNYHTLHPYKNVKKIHKYRRIDIKKIENIKKQILLINPPSPHPMTMMGLNSNFNPLGLGYIAAVLKKENFDVAFYNFWNKDVLESEFRRILSIHQPLLIGFSVMTENYENAILLAKIAKNCNPNIKILIGGPHVTFTDEETLKNKEVDIVVRGEGEETIVELANYFIKQEKNLSSINGISYRENKKILKNPPRSFITDLDKIPFPVRHWDELQSKIPHNIQTARGCPFKCKFCAATAISGGKYRKRSPENVVSEITYLVNKSGKRYFCFEDDTFTVDISRMFNILEMLKNQNIDILWYAESRVTIANENNIFDKMKKLGCESLQFGIESGSQDILDSINKNISLSDIEKAIRLATESGIRVVCSFIIGLPNDTYDTIQSTINLAEKLQVKYGAITGLSPLVPYPGTFIYNHIDDLGLKINANSYNDYNTLNPIIFSDKLPLLQLRNLYFDAFVRNMKNIPKNSVLHKYVPDYISKLFIGKN